MQSDNPLLLLGVSSLVLEKAQATGDLSLVSDIAKANFRTLARRFHSDVSGQSGELQRQFSEALEIIQDPDGLRFYLDELFDEASNAALDRRDVMAAERERLKETDEALYGLFGYINQFELLEIASPTSLFLSGEGRHILNVISPSESDYFLSNDWNEDIPPVPGRPRYVRGVWTERFMRSPTYAQLLRHSDLRFRGAVRVVGYVPETTEPYMRERWNGSEPPTLGISIGMGPIGLEFSDPAHCWFVHLIQTTKPTKPAHLAVWQDGSLALTPVVTATAIL